MRLTANAVTSRSRGAAIAVIVAVVVTALLAVALLTVAGRFGRPVAKSVSPPSLQAQLPADDAAVVDAGGMDQPAPRVPQQLPVLVPDLDASSASIRPFSRSGLARSLARAIIETGAVHGVSVAAVAAPVVPVHVDPGPPNEEPVCVDAMGFIDELCLCPDEMPETTPVDDAPVETDPQPEPGDTGSSAGDADAAEPSDANENEPTDTDDVDGQPNADETDDVDEVPNADETDDSGEPDPGDSDDVDEVPDADEADDSGEPDPGDSDDVDSDDVDEVPDADETDDSQESVSPVEPQEPAAEVADPAEPVDPTGVSADDADLVPVTSGDPVEPAISATTPSVRPADLVAVTLQIPTQVVASKPPEPVSSPDGQLRLFKATE